MGWKERWCDIEENERPLLDKVTSVGVVAYTGELARGRECSILFVEQLDQPERRWGIPAGKFESGLDASPEETAVREMLEETRLVITGGRLEPFYAIPKPPYVRPAEYETLKLIFKCQISQEEAEVLGNWQPIQISEWSSPLLLLRGPMREGEIGDMVLVPRYNLFYRGHPMTAKIFRPDLHVYLKWQLERLNII